MLTVCSEQSQETSEERGVSSLSPPLLCFGSSHFGNSWPITLKKTEPLPLPLITPPPTCPECRVTGRDTGGTQEGGTDKHKGNSAG